MRCRAHVAANLILIESTANHRATCGRSADSRVLTSMGYNPLENGIGRVAMIFFSRDAGDDGMPTVIHYERIGTMVQ